MDFIAEFEKKMEEKNLSFEITGLLTRDDRVYPFGTDTKVLSTIFELLIRPTIYAIANEHGFLVVEPEKQNFYPDFTLLKSTDDKNKIAVDVKTTYRNFHPNKGTWTAGFTLGSFASFMRNDTKNIVFPFSQYQKHFIVGFIYTRVDDASGVHEYSLDDRARVPAPFTDVEYFAQEKYRIASDRPGSGNTENIGSIIAGSVDEFRRGNGPFSNLGEEVFLDYWRNFPRYRTKGKYTNLEEYLAWKRESAS